MMAAETIGGLVPLTPYLITSSVQAGFMGGIVVTFASLFAIGVWKTTFTKKNKLRSGLEMVVAGTLATVIPYFIGNFLSSLALPI
jgi:predicted membrane protein (TIGR00267 family)